jgi:hypothetical protein
LAAAKGKQMTLQSISGMIVLARHISRRIVMERFVQRHQSRAAGVLSGFDRPLSGIVAVPQPS